MHCRSRTPLGYPTKAGRRTRWAEWFVDGFIIAQSLAPYGVPHAASATTPLAGASRERLVRRSRERREIAPRRRTPLPRSRCAYGPKFGLTHQGATRSSAPMLRRR
jgi:hypothetical protein